MDDLNVIDQFTSTFVTYIDSGFGLLGPDVAFLTTILIGIGNGMTIPNATAAAVSVKPDSAGAASGLMGSLQVGSGALASVLCGIMAGNGSGVVAFGAMLAAFGLVAFLVAYRAWRFARHPE